MQAPQPGNALERPRAFPQTSGKEKTFIPRVDEELLANDNLAIEPDQRGHPGLFFDIGANPGDSNDRPRRHLHPVLAENRSRVGEQALLELRIGRGPSHELTPDIFQPN
jgi:hypothetical protein